MKETRGDDVPRFVILRHDWKGLHFDWMFEEGETLLTWKTAEPPRPGAQLAESLPRHRRLYLDYEGPVSQDRGHVTRWESGEYEGNWSAEAALQWRLYGTKLRGTLWLQPLADRQWRLTFAPDAEAEERP